MYIPTLHEVVRQNWSQYSERVVECDEDNRRFWLRMKAGTVLFKLDDLNSPIVGAIFSEQSLSLNSSASPDELRACFAQGWSQNLAGRLLILPDLLSPQSSVLIGINATRFWLPSSESTYFSETTYSTKWTGDLWELPETELASQFNPEWNDADSMPRRAWNWHRLSSEEKHWSQLLWERGSQQKMENLTRAMMHSDSELWQERDLWGINYRFNFDGNATTESVRAHTILRPPSARIARLGQLFLEHNRAKLQRPPLLPALTPARSFSPDGYAWVHLRYSAPSQHEQLEAHLILRDWIADKVSAVEAQQLLPAI